MPDRPRTPDNKTPASKPTQRFARLIDLAAVALMMPVLLPLLVVFTPSQYLESDPRLLGDIRSIVISFGPAGSMWLAAAAIGVAAAAMAVTVLAGGKLRWWSCGFVAAGVVPCVLHMPEHFNSRLHGGTWAAAALLGLAAAHLGQFDRARRIIVAVLIAMLIPWCIQATWYVYVEHPATVQSFHDNIDRDLALRGLTQGSPEHAKYMTRLQGNDAIGAVGMSNVFGSLLAAVSVLALTTAVTCGRKRCQWVRVVGVMCALALGLWTLWLTQSKGAVLALCLTVALGVFLWLLTRLKLNLRTLAPVLCLLLVFSGSGAVLLRGAMGPPNDHHGERSLLFRYHYWHGALRLILDDPMRSITGVSPGLFKDRYEAVRNPISPEVVSSTHNVFVDQAVMLGVGGVAWSLLLLGWLWRAGANVAKYLNDSDAVDGEASSPPVKLFALLAAVVFGIQYYVQFPALYAETAILWLVGLLGFVGLAAFVVHPVLAKSLAWLGFGAALAAALLLLHAQIEMTFFWDSAAAFVWIVVGLASAGHTMRHDDRPRKPTGIGYMPAAVILVFAVVFAVVFAEPTARHQALLREANDALLYADPVTALRELDAAAEVIPNDPTTTQWRVGLRQEIATAYQMHDRDEGADKFLNEAMAVLDEAEAAGLAGVGNERRRAGLAMGAYQITGNRDWLRRAEAAYTRAVELSPNGLNDHVRLADARWQLGEFDSAVQAYRKALQISDNYYLDPDTQLPGAERERIELRIGGD